jgi:hypothetical protein
MYLARLPYSIELFEAIYAKTFIIDADNFPTRLLQPEKIIDKMVAYFSMMSGDYRQHYMAVDEPVDGAKMLDSFENVIRIVSYVQPNLYSRLLFFKYAIDRALLKFDKDLVSFNKSLNAVRKSSKSSGEKQAVNSSTQVSLVVSRAVNVQTCESVRAELSQTIENSQKALHRLNDYIVNLKSEKIYKEVELYLNELSLSSENNSSGGGTGKRLLLKSPKTLRKGSKRGTSATTASDERKAGSEVTPPNGKLKSEEDESAGSSLSTVCQSFIQHRLYLNKAMMNVIEPYLNTVKLNTILSDLVEKIDLDKEILLVFTHLKKGSKINFFLSYYDMNRSFLLVVPIFLKFYRFKLVARIRRNLRHSSIKIKFL